MKKLFYLIIFLWIGFINAQENTLTAFKKNEISINVFKGLFDKYPEIFYERILTKKIGLGTTLGVDYKDIKDSYIFAYMNYYPFGSEKSFKSYASGIFIQPGISVISQDYETETPLHNLYSSESVNVGTSMILGWKIIFKYNWVGSMHIGGGINIWKEAEESSDGYFTSGISIGKRF